MRACDHSLAGAVWVWVGFELGGHRTGKSLYCAPFIREAAVCARECVRALLFVPPWVAHPLGPINGGNGRHGAAAGILERGKRTTVAENVGVVWFRDARGGHNITGKEIRQHVPKRKQRLPSLSNGALRSWFLGFSCIHATSPLVTSPTSRELARIW